MPLEVWARLLTETDTSVYSAHTLASFQNHLHEHPDPDALSLVQFLIGFSPAGTLTRGSSARGRQAAERTQLGRAGAARNEAETVSAWAA